MATQTKAGVDPSLADRFRAVRSLSLAIAAPLSEATSCLQPMPDASPAKWHLAHTTWFFETFLLRDHVSSYRLHDERYAYLFNSYYEGEGDRHPRAERGLIASPSLDEVREWRAVVDAALLHAIDDLPADLIVLGLNHEQQHQELMLMDLTAAFAALPLPRALWDTAPTPPAALPPPIRWIEGREGISEIGHDGTGPSTSLRAGFAFDNVGPRHRVLLHPHALADRTVTNAEWIGFIDAGGYRDPLLWLADGWAWVQAEGIGAPLYWRRESAGWTRFGLDGTRPVDPTAPVCHISYYETDAYARWAGARLPIEAEWEVAADGFDPDSGNQLDSAGPVRPLPAKGSALRQMFGDVWEWTGSAYLPYPGFRPAAGAVGEYNGKFMCSQMVLRGGCCATPRGHMRASYRNFFYPHQRWMYSGLRLARDL
jgi:ergothioneine biosynthesis protein EgtB